jgi:hypothetical protein
VVKVPSEAERKKGGAKKAEEYRRDVRGIVVKRFDEVAVADVEIVFPDTEVGLKLIDLLSLYGTAAGALVGGVVSFVRGSVELSVIFSTMSVMGGKLFQVRCTSCCSMQPMYCT